MNQIRLLSAAILLVASTLAFGPARAADPVFPPGSRVGMTPLVGLVGAKTFVGFETEDQGVKVLVAELPAGAYGEVVNAFKANPAGSNGIKPESIETAAGRRLLYRRKRQGWRHQRAALFDDHAGRYVLRLYRGTGPRERQQDLHRRRGPADVRLGDHSQGSAGQRATCADAVRASPTSPSSRMSARWRRERPSFLPMATRPPASRPPPSC